jgi:hypothetical protein
MTTTYVRMYGLRRIEFHNTYFYYYYYYENFVIVQVGWCWTSFFFLQFCDVAQVVIVHIWQYFKIWKLKNLKHLSCFRQLWQFLLIFLKISFGDYFQIKEYFGQNIPFSKYFQIKHIAFEICNPIFLFKEFCDIANLAIINQKI